MLGLQIYKHKHTRIIFYLFPQQPPTPLPGQNQRHPPVWSSNGGDAMHVFPAVGSEGTALLNPAARIAQLQDRRQDTGEGRCSFLTNKIWRSNLLMLTCGYSSNLCNCKVILPALMFSFFFCTIYLMFLQNC